MKKIIIIATFFTGFIQSAYGMLVTECGPAKGNAQEEIKNWYAGNETQIKKNYNISPSASVYFLHAEIEDKRYVSVLKFDQVSDLDLKINMSTARNVSTIDMNQLVKTLSSSASLAGIHPLKFAIETTLTLRSTNTTDQLKAISLIAPSSEENKKEIIDALRPRLKHVKNQEEILAIIQNKSIEMSSSLDSTSPYSLRPTASFVMASAMLLGLVYILITYGKIYAKGIRHIT